MSVDRSFNEAKRTRKAAGRNGNGVDLDFEARCSAVPHRPVQQR